MAGDLSQIDLNLLYTFRAVVDAGGVGAAARLLGRTQPAITARIKQLETDLGTQLFERIGRNVELTPIGRIVDVDTRELVGRVQQIVDRASSASRGAAGVLRVGALPTVSTFLLAPILQGFLDAFPESRIEIVHGLPLAQLRALLDGKLDLVTSVGEPPQGHEAELTELGHVRAVLAVSAEHRPKPRSTVSIEQLRRMPLVGFGPTEDVFFSAVWSFLEARGLAGSIRLCVPHIQALKALILAGAGAGILPDYTVEEPTFVTRPVEALDVSEPLWVATRKSNAELPLTAAFRDYLLSEARDGRG